LVVGMCMSIEPVREDDEEDEEEEFAADLHPLLLLDVFAGREEELLLLNFDKFDCTLGACRFSASEEAIFLLEELVSCSIGQKLL
jgi:hypothetical protein